jgi:mRNA interferase YafQ
MYTLEFTNQYLKDLKIIRKRNYDEIKLNRLIKLLIDGSTLPPCYKKHKLSGKYKNLSECHISPDWILIYIRNTSNKLITLIRTGTHSDLYKWIYHNCYSNITTLDFTVNKYIEFLKTLQNAGYDFHPQRWTNNKTLWLKELVLQNIKNIAKSCLNYTRVIRG